ncbi:MATE family efflux transporter [Desulfobacterota bacterium M19]
MTKTKVYKDSFWNIFDDVSTLAIFLVTTKFLLENIGTDGYGFYTFFTSLIGTFGLVDLGMGMAVSKYLSEFLHHKKHDEANQVITIAFFFYVSIGMALFLIVSFFNTNIINFLNFGEKFRDIGATILVLTSIIFIINMVSTIMINTLVALEEWKRISLINIGIKILNSTILIFILTIHLPLERKISYIFYQLLTFSLLKASIYFFYSKKSFSQLSFAKPSIAVKNKMIAFLRVSALQYSLSLLVGHLDKFIISKMFGLESLGVYSFVANAFTYLYGLLTNTFKIYLPKLSKLHGDNNFLLLKDTFKKLLLYSLSVSIILAGTSLLIWKPFVSLYLNNEFALKSFAYMQIFALLLVIRSIEPIFAYFFNAIAKPSVLVVNVIIGSICTLIGYFVFIPMINIFGLVVSQITANIIVYAYNFFIIKKRGFRAFTQ